MRDNIESLLAPRSIAVIGASTTKGSIGNTLFSNILLGGYRGVVYPVNIRAKSVLGVKAYRSILEIDDEIDLAIIVVPARIVPEVIDECGKKGVKGAVIISAGFREIGEKGAELERRVVQKAKEHSIRVIGPNCFGIINTDSEISLNATFGRIGALKGNISILTQSGAIGLFALKYARSEGIGLSKFVSVGNKADVNENDILAYFKEDPSTQVIVLYLEDLSDPRGFLEISKEITKERKKPILAMKSGRTVEGARAASSHTGALSGTDEAFDGIFAQAGILRVETLEELFEYALAFSLQPIPRGRKIAIVTNAGGFGITATDAAIRNGLQLASFEENTLNKLRDSLPPTASINNPVDVIGDAREDRYEFALRNVLQDKKVDGLIVIWAAAITADVRSIAETIVNYSLYSEKPIIACLMPVTEEETQEVSRILSMGNVPNYVFPETAAKVLATMAKYGAWAFGERRGVVRFRDVEKEKAREIVRKAIRDGRNWLLEPEAMQVLRYYGFPVAKSKMAKSEEECVKVAEEIGYPVVLKVVSPQIIHKFDVGGVALNINGKEELIECLREMIRKVKEKKPGAVIEGVLVYEMVRGGKETIVGFTRDEKFGPLIMFGLGGVYVEALKDVSFRLAPLEEGEADEMIKEIKSYNILEGLRGERPSDIGSIVECLERLSQLSSDIEEISELDINPLIVLEKGAKVVDARIILKKS